jgi:allantoinase
MASGLTWPNGKKVAVSVTVMFETWADDKAPTYSVQTTHLKSGTVDHAGKAWSTYGGRVGVWRIIRLLDRLGIPGTFCVNARCTEEYPEAVKAIVRSGHDIAGHAYTQDQLLAYMSLEQQESTIRRSIDLLQQCGGKTVTGWASPVVAFTPETAGFLAKAGLTWTTDVTYADLPIKIHTAHGTIAGVPTTDFSDNRVLRANPRDLYHAQGHLRVSPRERTHGAFGARDPLPIRRPSSDRRRAQRAVGRARTFERCLVRPPRGTRALGARRRCR